MKTDKGPLFEAFDISLEEASWNDLTKSFTSNKHKNFIRARSIILDIHLQYEWFLNRSIFYLCFSSAKLAGFSVGYVNFLEAISRVGFARKLSIVSSLGILNNTDERKIYKINEIRNAFVHSKRIDDKVFKYSGKSIFELAGINKVLEDFHAVMDEFLSKMDKVIKGLPE